MPVTFTARQHNQDASSVKRAANDGPVFITERGKPAHVLMTISAYEQLKATKSKQPLVEFLETLPLGELDLTRDQDTGRDSPF
jgi:prevent-host-death family protein